MYGNFIDNYVVYLVQNCMAFHSCKLKCLETSMRWKIEISSSILKESEEATEINSWLTAKGEGRPFRGGSKTGTS